MRLRPGGSVFLDESGLPPNRPRPGGHYRCEVQTPERTEDSVSCRRDDGPRLNDLSHPPSSYRFRSPTRHTPTTPPITPPLPLPTASSPTVMSHPPSRLTLTPRTGGRGRGVADNCGGVDEGHPGPKGWTRVMSESRGPWRARAGDGGGREDLPGQEGWGCGQRFWLKFWYTPTLGVSPHLVRTLPQERDRPRPQCGV